MNQKQSLEILEQGKDAWNKWANKMLAEKDATSVRLQKSGRRSKPIGGKIRLLE